MGKIDLKENSQAPPMVKRVLENTLENLEAIWMVSDIIIIEELKALEEELELLHEFLN